MYLFIYFILTEIPPYDATGKEQYGTEDGAVAGSFCPISIRIIGAPQQRNHSVHVFKLLMTNQFDPVCIIYQLRSNSQVEPIVFMAFI